ncbi:MAG: DUF4381 domain-containing protein [Gammaproteobacteria bacterium]
MTTSAERFGDDFGAERMWGLKELPYPDPIAWLPQTPGWYVLGLVLFMVLAWLVWRYWMYRQRNAYRQLFIQRLEAVRHSQASVSEIPFLLRKAALLNYPRREVASLSGTAWQDLLNKSAARELFTTTDIQLLDQLAYRDPRALPEVSEPSVIHLLDQTKHWMRSHRA